MRQDRQLDSRFGLEKTKTGRHLSYMRIDKKGGWIILGCGVG